MAEKNSCIPVFVNLEQYKKVLSESQFPEEALELLFAHSIKASYDFVDLEDLEKYYSVSALPTLLEEWSFEPDGRKIFEPFTDIFSFEDYCQAMNLDAEKVTEKDIKTYVNFFMYDFSLVEDIIILEEGGFFYRKQAVQKAYESLKKYDVFHKKVSVNLGIPDPDNSTSCLVLEGANGKTREIEYTATNGLKAILLENECNDLVNLFNEKTWDKSYDANFDYFPDYFFACIYSFPQGVKIYNCGELVYEAAANMVRVFRYGECGFIIQLEN